MLQKNIFSVFESVNIILLIACFYIFLIFLKRDNKKYCDLMYLTGSLEYQVIFLVIYYSGGFNLISGNLAYIVYILFGFIHSIANMNKMCALFVYNNIFISTLIGFMLSIPSYYIYMYILLIILVYFRDRARWL